MESPHAATGTGLIRYWGSFFKFREQAEHWTSIFQPARQRGWRCYFVLRGPPEDDTWLRGLREAGVELVYLPRVKSNLDWRCVQAVRALCRRVRAEVIHCDNIHTSPMLGAALARVPVRVWTKNAMDPAFEQCRPPRLREQLALSNRLTCLLATRVVAVSEPVREELVQRGVPERKLVLRHNPRAGSPVSAAERAQARAALGYADSEVVLMTLGHAVPVKGWDLLLRAFAKLAPEEPRARLLYAGSTSVGAEQAHFAELNQLVTKHGLSGRVRFLGHVGVPKHALAAADVFVMPSRSEGFSYALVEALHAGLPCVATPVGIAPVAIRDGWNGFLVPRNEWQELARRLKLLVSDEALRSRLARAAKVPEFLPELPEYARGLVAFYASLLPERPGASGR